MKEFKMLSVSPAVLTGSAEQYDTNKDNRLTGLGSRIVATQRTTRRVGRRQAATLALIVIVAVAGMWHDSLLKTATPRAFFMALRSTAAVLSKTTVRNGPAQHIYFLKTHKCASTTVQRIVLTYAVRNNLSVALPTDSINNFYPKAFSAARAKRTCAYPCFDIMAAHALFSESARSEMPTDTVYVAIVRDPADQMESAYYYYLKGMCPRVPFRSLSFEQYLPMAMQHYGRVASSPTSRYPCDIRPLRFLQLNDFGFNPSDVPTPRQVQEAIRRYDALFDIVLVVERLDEGLILLRDLLGWSTADMLHLRSNFRVSSTVPKEAAAAAATQPLKMSNTSRRAAYAWNWGDKMLYDYFRAKMDAAIAQNETYLREQVSDFRSQQAAFYHRCVERIAARGTGRSPENRPSLVGGREGEEIKVSAGGRGRWWISSVGTERYLLSGSRNASYACQLAAMNELELFSHLNTLHPTCRTSGDG